MSAYSRDFDKNKCMSFLIKDENFLEKYNKILKKDNNILKKLFDSKPVCNEKCYKWKIKSYDEKNNTNFQNNEIPKVSS